MDFINIVLFAVAGVCISLLLKQNSREFAVLITIAVCVIIIAAGTNLLRPAVAFLNTLISKTNVSKDYFYCLLKSIGICCLSSFAQDLCIDNNERSIASSIEFVARGAVAITILPILKELAETAFKLG